ncbi:hypothetical protein [Kitasatospora cinereorecta]|uniref:Exo-alpha-sialidase n=1 Tax=Kitasatospora cinereorecta TaxID=285560 RepID=A0ABW0VK47_9ACTN
MSTDEGRTWQQPKSSLLREHPAKKLFAAAAESGRVLVYDPVAGHATGTVMNNEPRIDRFTRLESYLPDADQAPNWQLITAGEQPSNVVAVTVRLLIDDVYAAQGWAELSADGELRLRRPDRSDFRLRPIAADLSA